MLFYLACLGYTSLLYAKLDLCFIFDLSDVWRGVCELYSSTNSNVS